jgi:hypothetical protein
MDYAEHDGPRAGATSGAFWPSGPHSSNGVRYADSGRFAPTDWYPDADTGIYPVLDGYPGYQRYAGEPPAPGAHQRPVRPPELDHDPAHLAPVGYLPAHLAPVGYLPARQAPAGYLPVRDELAGSLAAGPPPGRLARLRPDRWILAIGGLAAAVAVIVAFATAGGSTTANTAKTAQTATTRTATTHAVLPGCVWPRAGR